MEDSIKNVITALLADDDSALKELFRAQVEDVVNQFLQNEMTAVLGYEPYEWTGQDGSETIAMATITGPLTQRWVTSPSKRHAIGWSCLRMPCLSPMHAIPQRLKKRSS